MPRRTSVAINKISKKFHQPPYQVIKENGDGTRVVSVDGRLMISKPIGGSIVGIGNRANTGGKAPADEPAIHYKSFKKAGLEE